MKQSMTAILWLLMAGAALAIDTPQVTLRDSGTTPSLEQAYIRRNGDDMIFRDPAGSAETTLNDLVESTKHAADASVHWPRPAQTIVVAKDGTGQFSTIQAAVDSITDSSESNPYLIDIAPGVYGERVTLNKDYVTLRGAGMDATTITYGYSSILTIESPCAHATIEDLTLRCTQSVGTNTATCLKKGTDAAEIRAYNTRFLSTVGKDTIFQSQGHDDDVFRFFHCEVLGNYDIVSAYRGAWWFESCRFRNYSTTSAIVWFGGASVEETYHDCMFEAPNPTSPIFFHDDGQGGGDGGVFNFLDCRSDAFNQPGLNPLQLFHPTQEFTTTVNVTAGTEFSSIGSSVPTLNWITANLSRARFWDGYVSGEIAPASLSADRVWTLPDRDGTFAMLEGVGVFRVRDAQSGVLFAVDDLASEIHVEHPITNAPGGGDSIQLDPNPSGAGTAILGRYGHGDAIQIYGSITQSGSPVSFSDSYGQNLYLSRDYAPTGSGQRLGNLYFSGSDGATIRSAARIAALSDGAWSGSSTPSRLVFYTTASGATSPSNALEIRADRDVRAYADLRVDGYLQTGGHEFVARDVLRHTLSAAEASSGSFSETWSGATAGKIVSIQAVYFDASAGETYGDQTSADAWTVKTRFDGSALTVTRTGNLSWSENDTVTVSILYEQ